MIKKIILFPIILFCCSCGEKTYFEFKQNVQIKAFPEYMTLASPDTIDTGAIGIQGIEIFKDFILLSCKDSMGCLSAFTKNGDPISRPFLQIGRGPGEILYQPFMSWLSIEEQKGGHITAGLYDFKGNYINYDVTKSLKEGFTVWSCLADSLPVLWGARYFKAGGDRLICRMKKETGNGYERLITDYAGNAWSSPPMDTLNSFTSSDCNLLSTSFAVNTKKGIVAESGSRLHVIHLYSLDGSTCLTINVGDKKDNLNDLESLPPEAMPKVYYEAKAYDDFFAALYIGTTVEDLNEGNPSAPELQIFSWEGKPLASITLPPGVLYFDIDIETMSLYTVDSETEKILKYDISDFFELYST